MKLVGFILAEVGGSDSVQEGLFVSFINMCEHVCFSRHCACSQDVPAREHLTGLLDPCIHQSVCPSYAGKERGFLSDRLNGLGKVGLELRWYMY